MKTLKFKNGDSFPSLGLGTWLARPNEVYDAVLEAIRCGYRHIDCAYIYKNEVEVGMALNYAFSYGIVKREEMFITSKLWNCDHHPDRIENAIQRSLSNLQLKKLDLYLMHWPIAFKAGIDVPEGGEDLLPLDEMPLSETWLGMERLKRKGLTEHIGVSNFNIPKLRKLIADTRIRPEVNQVELHPFLQQDELLDYCRKEKILATAYSPLGGRRMANLEDGLLQNQLLRALAEKHACTPSQVILAWGMQRGCSVIPKSVNPERIRENLAALRVKLDAEDMAQIKKLDRNLRMAKADFAVFPNGPYTYQSIWED